MTETIGTGHHDPSVDWCVRVSVDGGRRVSSSPLCRLPWLGRASLLALLAVAACGGGEDTVERLTDQHREAAREAGVEATGPSHQSPPPAPPPAVEAPPPAEVMDRAVATCRLSGAAGRPASDVAEEYAHQFTEDYQQTAFLGCLAGLAEPVPPEVALERSLEPKPRGR